MAKEAISFLIALVRDRPVVWDQTLNSDRLVRQEAWNEIFMALNTDFVHWNAVEKKIFEINVKKKWHNIRFNYFKSIQKGRGTFLQCFAERRRDAELSFLKKVAPSYEDIKNDTENDPNPNGKRCSGHFTAGPEKRTRIAEDPGRRTRAIPDSEIRIIESPERGTRTIPDSEIRFIESPEGRAITIPYSETRIIESPEKKTRTIPDYEIRIIESPEEKTRLIPNSEIRVIESPEGGTGNRTIPNSEISVIESPERRNRTIPDSEIRIIESPEGRTRLIPNSEIRVIESPEGRAITIPNSETRIIESPERKTSTIPSSETRIIESPERRTRITPDSEIRIIKSPEGRTRLIPNSEIRFIESPEGRATTIPNSETRIIESPEGKTSTIPYSETRIIDSPERRTRIIKDSETRRIESPRRTMPESGDVSRKQNVIGENAELMRRVYHMSFFRSLLHKLNSLNLEQTLRFQHGVMHCLQHISQPAPPQLYRFVQPPAVAVHPFANPYPVMGVLCDLSNRSHYIPWNARTSASARIPLDLSVDRSAKY